MSRKDNKLRRSVARTVVIAGSLACSGGMLVFFILAPSLGYRIEWSDAMKAAETAVPPFLGYIGAAVAFVLGRNSAEKDDVIPNLGLLIVGPFAIFAVAFVSLIVAFRTGDHPENFQAWLTAILSVVTLTVGVASQKLFSAPHEESHV